MNNYIVPPSTLPPGSTVWAYLRDSGGESQEQSIDQQRKEIKAYALHHKLVLLRIFEDVARSGGSTTKRTQFREMIELSFTREHPGGLLVWNYARFARNKDDAALYRAQLRNNGIVIHSLNDFVPEGDFRGVAESVIDLANALQSKKNSQDVKRALAERVKAGYSSGGTPPRGYISKREVIGHKRNGDPRIGTKWIPDPELAPLVKLAFALRAEGKSLAEIKTATAGRLYAAKNSWTTFFRNRSYLGIGKCGSLEVPEHHPALVDIATFQQVQNVTQKARKNQQGNLLHHKRLNSPSLLSGLGECLLCGTPLILERGGKNKWRAYLCGKKRRYGYHSCKGRQINADRADQIITDTILEKVLTPTYAYNLILETQAHFANSNGIQQDKKQAEKNLAVIKGIIERLTHSLERTGSPAIERRIIERETEQAQLEFELATIEGREAIAGHLIIDPAALEKTLNLWRGEIQKARASEDIRGLQSLVRKFTTKIELGYNQAKITYTYPIDTVSTKKPEDLPSAVYSESFNKTLEVSWGKNNHVVIKECAPR